MMSLRRVALRALSSAPGQPLRIASFASRSGSFAVSRVAALQSFKTPIVPLIRCYATEQSSEQSSSLEENKSTIAATLASQEASAVETQAEPQSERAVRSSRSAPVDEPEPSATLFIGNLYFESSEDTVKEVFENFGDVRKVTIVKDGRGLSKGFGYIEMGSIEEATQARENLHSSIIEGRPIVVQYAVFRKERAPRAKSNQPSRTLFIGNLSYQMTDADLNQLFRNIDGILDVRVAIDRKTGQPRGFAHADFASTEQAVAAAKMLENKSYYGRQIRLDYASNPDRKLPRTDDSAQQF